MIMFILEQGLAFLVTMVTAQPLTALESGLVLVDSTMTPTRVETMLLSPRLRTVAPIANTHIFCASRVHPARLRDSCMCSGAKIKF